MLNSTITVGCLLTCVFRLWGDRRRMHPDRLLTWLVLHVCSAGIRFSVGGRDHQEIESLLLPEHVTVPAKRELMHNMTIMGK